MLMLLSQARSCAVEQRFGSDCLLCSCQAGADLAGPGFLENKPGNLLQTAQHEAAWPCQRSHQAQMTHLYHYGHFLCHLPGRLRLCLTEKTSQN